MNGHGHKWIGLGSSLLVWALGGCGDDGGAPSGETEIGTSEAALESTGGPAPVNTAPTFEALVDAAAACTAGASALELRATRFACADPPPAPCTLPNPLRTDVGDRIDCPSTETDATLRLAASSAGRFYVEVVTIAGDGTEVGECHSDTTESDVFVDKDAFDTNPTIAVAGLSSPCPEP
jgi:hypothetical protein